jgi:pyridoxal biosynthesis lyase PdxS
LNEAVEAAGKNALQTPANVAVGLAFGAASCFVVAGIFMAAEPGDRNGVQGAVEVSVAHSAEPVPGALAAAGFEWGDACE